MAWNARVSEPGLLVKGLGGFFLAGFLVALCLFVLAPKVEVAVTAGAMQPAEGFAYRFSHKWPKALTVFASLQGDNSDHHFRSNARLFENGRMLPLPHASHDDIRRFGQGRYSHWKNREVIFAASDNSDPRTNGRAYTLVQQVQPTGLGLALPLLGLAIVISFFGYQLPGSRALEGLPRREFLIDSLLWMALAAVAGKVFWDWAVAEPILATINRDFYDYWQGVHPRRPVLYGLFVNQFGSLEAAASGIIPWQVAGHCVAGAFLGACLARLTGSRLLGLALGAAVLMDGSLLIHAVQAQTASFEMSLFLLAFGLVALLLKTHHWAASLSLGIVLALALGLRGTGLILLISVAVPTLHLLASRAWRPLLVLMVSTVVGMGAVTAIDRSVRETVSLAGHGQFVLLSRNLALADQGDVVAMGHPGLTAAWEALRPLRQKIKAAGGSDGLSLGDSVCRSITTDTYGTVFWSLADREIDVVGKDLKPAVLSAEFTRIGRVSEEAFAVLLDRRGSDIAWFSLDCFVSSFGPSVLKFSQSFPVQLYVRSLSSDIIGMSSLSKFIQDKAQLAALIHGSMAVPGEDAPVFADFASTFGPYARWSSVLETTAGGIMRSLWFMVPLMALLGLVAFKLEPIGTMAVFGNVVAFGYLALMAIIAYPLDRYGDAVKWMIVLSWVLALIWLGQGARHLLARKRASR